MLVLDPKKRISIAQMKQHKWMLRDGGPPKDTSQCPVIGQNAKNGEYNEQILRLMQSLGIDQGKTVEVSVGQTDSLPEICFCSKFVPRTLADML